MENTNKRITKADRFNELMAFIPTDRDDLKEFVAHELDLLAKKNSSEKKPTKVQQENENMKKVILSTLASAENPVTISELQKLDDSIGEMSNQKVAALVRALVSDGKVERIEDKRKAYFKIA